MPQASHFNTDEVNRAGFSKLFMEHSDKMWARGKVQITYFHSASRNYSKAQLRIPGHDEICAEERRQDGDKLPGGKIIFRTQGKALLDISQQRRHLQIPPAGTGNQIVGSVDFRLVFTQPYPFHHQFNFNLISATR